MGYLLLANALAATHLMLVAFLVAGGLLFLPWPRLAVLHAPLAASVLALNLARADCPLTVFELYLRRIGGGHAYAGGFIGHYLVDPIHPGGITPEVRVCIYAIAVLPNVLGYAFLAWRVLSRRGMKRPVIA